MSYYRVCPNCGSHLDPGERRDCKTSERLSYHRQPIPWARDSPAPLSAPRKEKRQSMPVSPKAKV